jgi:hypothetical protein
LFGSGWRPVFLVNVPIGIIGLAFGWRLLPGDAPGRSRRVDLWGLATSVPAVLLIVLPLVLGHQQGWPAWTFVALACGALLAVAFVLVERKVTDPLLDLRIVRSPGVSSGMLTLALAMMAYGGFLFSMALHLQEGLGDSALRTGLTFAPSGAAFGLIGLTWRRLPAQWHRGLTTVGLFIAAGAFTGIAVALHSGHQAGAGTIGWLILAGLGLGTGFGALLAHALVHVPPARAADASGLLTTTIQLSQVVGVAVFGSVFLSEAVHNSAHAIGVTMGSLGGVLLAAAAGGVLLARAARRPTITVLAESD